MLIAQEITVIGGGVAGLAAARALALRGARVTLHERAPALREVGAGLQISPNGLRVLDALGLGGDLRDVATRAEAVALHDARGEVVTRIPLGAGPDAPPYLFAHRADLIDILARGAREAGVEIRLGSEISAEIAPGGLRLTGPDGEAAIAPLVIGADGVRSRLRACLEQSAPPAFTGQVAWRAVVDAPSPGEARVFMGPGRHIVAYPLSGGARTNLVAVEERASWAEEGWSHPGDPEVLRARFSDFKGPAAELLRATEAVFQWGLFTHPIPDPLFRGPLALIGDAAHPMLPFMAQGANMALEDAWVLGRALAEFPDPRDAVAAYSAERRPRVARVVETSRRNAWKYHLRNPALRFAAHSGLRLAGRLAPGALARQFDWLYGHDVTR
ncbi:FAD-dependent oxidoreductase [Poseidonocella sedimentorum]|uniref:Salicylate hydroxylase n=1 Tax=Poseidonocella sedimentorum TaxID=871652 RepID=A0A1I6DG03_9RHOB|nr:FAD-dependent oxidoreductase [Poseidonocella sedimentorum]SFR04252.1 salicylate hydroxylase [Poseidonocella sedimentorum]